MEAQPAQQTQQKDSVLWINKIDTKIASQRYEYCWFDAACMFGTFLTWYRNIWRQKRILFVIQNHCWLQNFSRCWFGLGLGDFLSIYLVQIFLEFALDLFVLFPFCVFIMQFWNWCWLVDVLIFWKSFTDCLLKRMRWEMFARIQHQLESLIFFCELT